MISNNYIVKTRQEGVKLLILNDNKDNQYQIQHLLDANDGPNHTHSLHIDITNDHIHILTTQNDDEINSVVLMKVPIVKF
jgi:hypothetical protein